MKTISYYLNPKNERYDYKDLNFGSREDFSRPLIVNCAGYVNANYNHTNTNTSGRLDYYLIYLISGEIEFLSDDNPSKLSQGNLIVYPSKTPYKYSCIANEQNVQFFWVHFTGSEVLSILQNYGISLFPLVHKISVNNHIDARFKALFDAFAVNDKYRDNDLSALLDRLLIEIGRVLSTKGTGIGRLHKSVRYINEHFTEQIKITDLAMLENMCMTTYNLHFKKYVGTPLQSILYDYACSMQLICSSIVSCRYRRLLQDVDITTITFSQRLLKTRLAVRHRNTERALSNKSYSVYTLRSDGQSNPSTASGPPPLLQRRLLSRIYACMESALAV